MSRILWLALLALLIPASSMADVLKNGRLFYLRTSFGWGFQSLEALNDDLEEIEQTLASLGVPTDVETFGGAPDIGFELGFRLTTIFSLGFGFNYQWNEVSNTYPDPGGPSIQHDIKVSIVDVGGNMCLWIPDTGVFVGGSAGFGLANIEEDIYAGFMPSSVDGDDSQLVGTVFTGYQVVFSSGLLLFAKGGYAFRELSSFETAFGEPITVDVDFSGPFALIGVGFSAGRLPRDWRGR